MRSVCLLKGQDYLPCFFVFFSHLRTAHLTQPSSVYDVVQAATRRELTAIALIFANQVKRVSDKCLTGVPLLNESWRNDLTASCKIDFVTWIMAPECLHMFYVDCVSCKCLLRRALFYIVALFLELSPAYFNPNLLAELSTFPSCERLSISGPPVAKSYVFLPPRLST